MSEHARSRRQHMRSNNNGLFGMKIQLVMKLSAQVVHSIHGGDSNGKLCRATLRILISEVRHCFLHSIVYLLRLAGQSIHFLSRMETTSNHSFCYAW